MFGNPEVTTGGRALKFYSTIRLDIRKADVIKSGTDIIGNKTKIKVVKNKVAPPFKQVEVDILYGKGISLEGCLLDAAVDLGIIEKSGSWFSYEGQRIGQGRDNAKDYIAEHSDFGTMLDSQIHAMLDQLSEIVGSGKKKPLKKVGAAASNEDDDADSLDEDN